MLQNIEKYNGQLLATLIVLNLLDFITTYFCISLGGDEANPLLAYLIVEMGTVWVILYAKLMIIAALLPFFVIATYYPDSIRQYVRPGFMRFVAGLLLAVNTGYLYVVGHNLYLIHVLTS